MDDRDYKAFIVEGEFREPQVIDNISKRFFNHGNCKLIPLPAGENIYMLWKKLVQRIFIKYPLYCLGNNYKIVKDSVKELKQTLDSIRKKFQEWEIK